MNGIVRVDDCRQIKEVCTALSGARPWSIDIHEIGLEHPQHSEVILHRFHVESCSLFDQGTRCGHRGCDGRVCSFTTGLFVFCSGGQLLNTRDLRGVIKY